MLELVRKNVFVISLLCLFILSDIWLTRWDPVSRFDIFSKNDFQRTVHANPEQEWSKVIYGNSAVIASYDETISESGYVNLGLNYGKITDLDAMLSQGMVKIEDKLILGLNLFTFMDELPTDPSYGWRRAWYEPYLYFYRDQIAGSIDRYFMSIVKGQSVAINRKKLYSKELYYGTLQQDKLDSKIKEYKEKYYVMTLEDFKDNLDALDRVIAYTQKHNIQLDVIWMPWNPKLESPAYLNELKAQVSAKLVRANIQVVDWMNKFQPEQFHDLGHLNVQRGRPLFTKELDQWVAE